MTNTIIVETIITTTMNRMNVMAKYNIQDLILEKSQCNNDWDIAIKEWYISNIEDGVERKSTCLCGQKHIRYLYTIKNIKNNNILTPIGSSCIKKLNSEDLTEWVNITKDLFTLINAINNSEFIMLTPKYFSLMSLRKLYEGGAFKPNQYNKYDGRNDYEFLVKMFDILNFKGSNYVSEKQNKKIRGLIGYAIRPYLENLLKNNGE